MGIAIWCCASKYLTTPLPDVIRMTAADIPNGSPTPARRSRGRPYSNVNTGRMVSLLAAGMVIGAVIGSSIAFLVAPRSGYETRRSISRRARRLREGSGPWKKLGRELQRAARAKRKFLEAEARRNELQAKRAQQAIV